MKLYGLYYKAMYNTCLRIVRNETEAEDIMQESFLSAFENISSYNGSVSFGSWLKRIVINRSLDYMKKNSPVMVEAGENLNTLPDNDDSEEPEFIIEQAQAIKSAISALPDGYRIILSLNLLEGYDHEEISFILNITQSTSRSQLARAKKRLIEIMKSVN